jgi:hypothetical protein
MKLLEGAAQTGSAAHQTSYPMGNGDNFLGLKQPERESHLPRPSSPEVKSDGTYLSIPTCLHGVGSIT